MGNDTDAALRSLAIDLAAHGLLAPGITPAAFVEARRYAAHVTADADAAWALLAPNVVTNGRAAALLATAAGQLVAEDVLAMALAPDGGRDPWRERRTAPPGGADPDGFALLGPVLAGFAAWAWGLIDGAPAEAAVVGVMRDGGLLAASLRAARPAAESRVTEAWLGRRACLLAALYGADDAEGLRNLLVRSRGRPARMAEIQADFGLAGETGPLRPDEPVVGDAVPAVLAWLAGDRRARAAVAETGTRLRRGIVSHLRGLGLLGRPLVLLDVGYAGTVQRLLPRILVAEGVPAPVTGLYLATTPGVVWAARTTGMARGYLVDHGAPVAVAGPLIRSREVVEALLGSADGPLAGYAPDGTPRLGPPVAGPAQTADLARIQAGALAFVETPGTVATATADHDAARTRARAIVWRLLAVPCAREAGRWGGWIHEDALATDGPQPLTGDGRLPDAPTAVLTAPRVAVLWPAGRAALDGAGSGDLLAVALGRPCGPASRDQMQERT